MAERKFDYNAVKDVYGGMKSINEQIKTLLTESDSEVKDKVSVVDEALYGDLGAQMLLNWENISSNFPSFMDNFDNWAALVSKASGNYQQFEVKKAFALENYDKQLKEGKSPVFHAKDIDLPYDVDYWK
jgi:hypothetical protein